MEALPDFLEEGLVGAGVGEVVFVEDAWVGAAVGQVGDDEAWVGAFAQVFGFGDDVARAASTSVEPCAASRSDVRNLATSTWPPQVTYNGG